MTIGYLRLNIQTQDFQQTSLIDTINSYGLYYTFLVTTLECKRTFFLPSNNLIVKSSFMLEFKSVNTEIKSNLFIGTKHHEQHSQKKQVALSKLY